jgi:hypothetical protein
VVGSAEADVCWYDRAFGSGVAVVALGEPVELLTAGLSTPLVQPAEQIVEGPVLEHDDDEMVEPGLSAGRKRGEAVLDHGVCGLDDADGRVRWVRLGPFAHLSSLPTMGLVCHLGSGTAR